MDGRFRVTAPTPRATWIDRPRLRRRLHRRFDVPLLVVVAPAGYGKTSALAQALAAGADGRDLWVQCQPDDKDHHHFARTVLRAAAQHDDGEHSIDEWALRIADVMAGFAPEPVCLVLDDVHRIDAESSTWSLLRGLLDRLPRTGHLLLAGRVSPPLAIARRRAQGQVEQLGVADLEFDDHELAAFGGDLVGRLGDGARWPALSALAADSPGSTIEFLAEEVVEAWDPDRRVVLAALAELSDVDEAAVRAASRGAFGADDVLGGLPLVQRSAEGSYQLHDLWRQALAEAASVDAAARDDAIARIAAGRRADGRLLEAAELYGAAAAVEGLHETLLTFAAQPFMVVPAADVQRMTAIARAVLGDHSITELLACFHQAIVGDERAAAARFAAVAERAAADSDPRAEALALMHAVNLYSVVDADRIPRSLGQRAATVAATSGERWATIADVLARHHAARTAGRADEAARVLHDLIPPTTDREMVSYAFGMIDLGRPEEFEAVVDPITGGPAASRLDLAAGAWLRGSASPELALAIGQDLLRGTTRAGIPHLEVPTSATFALVAVAAGANDAALGFAEAARRRCSSTACVDPRLFVLIADAACALATRGEDEAREALEAALAIRPIGRWPAQPYLFALPTLYALAGSSRAPLDRCRFGPALDTALHAGRALVALRERGDARRATELPWERVDLLRAHVAPGHLAELAAAAAAGGDARAGAVIDVIPAARRHLQRVGAHDHGATARWAATRVKTMPERPAYDLAIGVLGSLALARGSVPVTEAGWVRRDRVRQLLAYLALRRRTSRRAAAEALWPELDVERGMHNLRVNLAHLQRVLQPDRPAPARPWFVAADGEWLTLDPDGVEIDVDVFDGRLREARRFDEQALISDAVVAYERALAVVRGGYLDDVDDRGWADAERRRVRSLVISARCRRGELLLARGEPETAAQLAVVVLADEPVQERAGRLLAHALHAQGDRATARLVVRDLCERLADHGLDAEPATQQLARAYGLEP